MKESLKEKLEVVKDLLINHDADEVSITGTDIKVKKAKQGSGSPSQIIYIQAQASAQSSIAISVRLTLACSELEEIYKNGEISEIKKKVALLEKELVKAKPNKNILKKILKWALNFGWDAFLKLAPIIIDKLLRA